MDDFIKQLENIKAERVGAFSNEHGELFVLYTLPSIPLIFVTGDELDWEMGWRWTGTRALAQEFILSEVEFSGIKNIVSNIKKKK